MRLPMTRMLAWLAGLAALMPTAAGAQVLTGRVLEADTRAAIAGAAVTLLDQAGAAAATALTAGDGRFILLAPRPGTYGVRAERLGYASGRTDTVSVGTSETVVMELVLAADAIALEPLRVVARDRSVRQRLLREHYQRMERLEDQHGRTMFPRSELVRYESMTYEAFMRALAPPIGRVSCSPVVYWDGWSRQPDAPMPITHIEGIEFHQGMGPVDSPFINPTGCGVILVWTRPYDESDRFTLRRTLTAALLGGALILISTVAF